MFNMVDGVFAADEAPAIKKEDGKNVFFKQFKVHYHLRRQ